MLICFQQQNLLFWGFELELIAFAHVHAIQYFAFKLKTRRLRALAKMSVMRTQKLAIAWILLIFNQIAQTQKLCHPGIGGILEQLLWATLLHNQPVVHNDQAICQAKSLLAIMGYIDEGIMDFAQNITKLIG